LIKSVSSFSKARV